jgi:hypothetical protein
MPVSPPSPQPMRIPPTGRPTVLPKGDKYGDALAAPITSALDLHSSAKQRQLDHRQNHRGFQLACGQPEGRSPACEFRSTRTAVGSSGQSTTSSFYERPCDHPSYRRCVHLSIAKASTAGQVTISWTGTGTLEATTAHWPGLVPGRQPCESTNSSPERQPFLSRSPVGKPNPKSRAAFA